MMEKNVRTMFQRALMIWDGCDILLAGMII